MIILQINTVCGTGSTGRIATDLHAILLSQKHQSTIAFGRHSAKNCKNTIRIGSILGNYLHVARTRFFDSHGFGSSSATRKLVDQIKTLNPDVIHLHNLHGYYLDIALLFDFLKEAKKPVIWTLHDCWSFTGHCAYFDFAQCERWKRQCHDCPSKSDYPKSVFIDRSHKNFLQKREIFTGVKSLTIVTPSKWLAALVEQSFLQEYPITVINNGIDLNVFRPATSDFRKRFNLEHHFLILGVASVWDERKGYKYFCELAKQLRHDEKILLVGLNASQLKKLPSGIIGLAKTNSTAELAELYSTADIFLNPTLEDNFPTTNLESLACGTPVVTFNSGGSPECLDNGCGGVVERGDLQGLLSAIATVRTAGKAAYSIHCQELAKSRFDKNARFAEYIDLYKSSISGFSINRR